MVTVDCCRQRKGRKNTVCVCVYCIFLPFLCPQQPTVCIRVQFATFLKCLILSARSRRFSHPLHPIARPSVWLLGCPWGVAATPPPHLVGRGVKNGGQALNPHMKQAQTLSSKVYWKTLGGQERRFVWGTTSPPSALQHGFASVRPCSPVAPK